MRHVKTYKAFESHEIFTNKSGENFWGDVGSGILPICKSTGRVLVAYRSEFVNEPNTWGVFGGSIDGSETPIAAARRELEEETGYRGHSEIVPAYVFKSPGGGFSFYNFIGVVDHEFDADLDWETEDTRWVTLDELYDLEPKHFGLEKLLDESGDIIKKYAK